MSFNELSRVLICVKIDYIDLFIVVLNNLYSKNLEKNLSH